MYIVIEMQTTAGNVSTLTYSYDNLADAQTKYYLILSVAVKSNVDIHGALILDQYGATLSREYFDHTGAIHEE